METTKHILNKFELEEALDFVKAEIQLFEIFGRYNNISISKLEIDLKKNFPKYSKYLYRYNNKFELFLGLLKQDKNLPTPPICINGLSNSDNNINSFLFLKQDYKNQHNSAVGIICCFQFYGLKEFKNIIWV